MKPTSGPGHAEHKSMNRIILGELGQKATERLQKASRSSESSPSRSSRFPSVSESEFPEVRTVFFNRRSRASGLPWASMLRPGLLEKRPEDSLAITAVPLQRRVSSHTPMQAASDIQQKIWEKLICNVFVGGVPSEVFLPGPLRTDDVALKYAGTKQPAGNRPHQVG